MMGAVLAHAGSVRRIEADRALVAVATSGCNSCGHAAGCGIGKVAGGRRETVIAVPADGLRVGQSVTLELDEAQLTRAALFGYLLPAVLLILGALAGDSLAGDAAAALGALGGLGLGILLGRLRAPLLPRLAAPAATISMFPQEKHHV